MVVYKETAKLISYKMVKRFYRRRRRSLTNQYLRAKIDYVDEITWTNTQQAGSPFFVGQNTDRVAISTICEGDEFIAYRAIFGYWKVYAVKIVVKPITALAANNQNSGTMFVGFNPDSDDGANFDQAKYSNMSVIVSGTQDTYMFRKLDNSVGYLTTVGAMRGSFYVRSNYDTVRSNGQKWSIRCSLYVLFKNQRI